MRTPAQIAKHPIHPMLVPIPIGLWIFSPPLWLSLIGVGLLAVSGWLGGKMVYVHAIAVDAAPDTTTARRR
jgi:uncharacterized membrane protein